MFTNLYFRFYELWNSVYVATHLVWETCLTEMPLTLQTVERSMRVDKTIHSHRIT
jgi:hypothetical protein